MPAQNHDCDKCPFHAAHESRLNAQEADIKALFDRMRPLEDSRVVVIGLKESFEKFSVSITLQIQSLTQNMTQKFEELAGRPGKRWDKLIDLLIGAAIGAIVGLLFKK